MCISRSTPQPASAATTPIKVITAEILRWYALFWDRALDQDDDVADSLSEALITEALGVASTLPDADSSVADDLETSIWINESFTDAQSKVYVAPIEEGNGPFQQTESYRNAATEEAKLPIALAGARLANVLNRELK